MVKLATFLAKLIEDETKWPPFCRQFFKCSFLNFLNENVWISILLKFVPQGQISNIPALVQIMAWHQLCDKPLSEPMMVKLPMHIYISVTQPQWVKVKTAFLMENYPSAWHNLCYGCRWPGNTWNQGISSHAVDLVILEYFVPINWSDKTSTCSPLWVDTLALQGLEKIDLGGFRSYWSCDSIV